ncbi:MAG: hypothetical protein ACW9XB_03975 [Candidatus Nitrosopumilus sp. metabat.KBP569_Feb_25m_nospike.7]|nr:hypothetical protein [Nitrosopumilus sp.]
MDELKVKKDFTGIYTEESPCGYLMEMRKLGYSISDSTKPLYNSIVEELENKLSRPINILDLGSSYGINSALMKYNLTMAELNNFFLTETEPTKKETKQFYEKCTSNDEMCFYQIDISEEALKFSEEMGLCKKGINVNLDDEKLEMSELLPKVDVVIATGCIGYIGYMAFVNLLKVIKNRQSNSIEDKTEYNPPIFAFSVLRMFDMNDIEKTFERYNYSILKRDMKPIIQRKFSDAKEKDETVSMLHGMGISTKEYEDDGNFYADFYIAKYKN